MQALKSLTYKILCNPLTGSVIRSVFRKIPDLRWRNFSFCVPGKSVNNTIAASVFWGFYESSEIRFVEKYFKGDMDVVELGSSLGIVSSHISSKLQDGKRLISVEANPLLINTIRSNVSKHITEKGRFEVVNRAIDYDAPTVILQVTDNNTESRIGADGTSDGHSIETSTLSEIIKQFELHNFLLVCDIEGSEAGIFVNDQEAFANCRHILLELHDTTYRGTKYHVADLLKMLTDIHHYSVVESHGPVYFLSKSEPGH